MFFFDKQKTSHAGLSSPDDYIKELGRNDVSGEHLLKSLQSVRVSLTGRPLRYVGGLENFNFYVKYKAICRTQGSGMTKWLGCWTAGLAIQRPRVQVPC